MKLESTMFKKVFNSFEDGLSAMMSKSETIDNIFTRKNSKDNFSIVDAQYAVMDYVADNVPDLVNKKNIYTSLSISGNKVLLKTNNFVGCGWNISYEYDSETRSTKNYMYEFAIIVYGNKQDEFKQELLNDGWVISNN